MDVSLSKKPGVLPFASGMLRGRAAVVTGSTSGIGLGIAAALAAQGADVLLNGFGKAEEIEDVRSSLATAHGVHVSYSAADMSKLLGDKQHSLEFATPEQIGALAAFLCPDAAAQILGAALPVDGGWSAQ